MISVMDCSFCMSRTASLQCVIEGAPLARRSSWLDFAPRGAHSFRMEGVPTPEQLRGILAEILAGAAGGTVGQWLKAIGPVEKLPFLKNMRSNWAVHPVSDVDAVNEAARIVREAHPYVAG